MAAEMNLDSARTAIDGGMDKAKEFLDDPAKMDELLAQLQEKVQDLPATIGSAFASIPTMVDMVKGYLTQEYTEVSPKVVVALVSSFLYLVKGKDIIPDSIPVIGLVDDLAVVTVALKLCEPELEAFKAWRDSAERADAGAGLDKPGLIEA